MSSTQLPYSSAGGFETQANVTAENFLVNGVITNQVPQGNVLLQSSTSNWIFNGTAGNLILPSNTAAINYANGMSILSGITGSGGGTVGATGATGPAGDPGGATGATGATGASGIDGATGASGIDGATGASGLDGATGASGIDGATGATGDVGATGLTGDVGATGLTGDVGATGLTGDVGATGTPGDVGATGLTGDVGATGLTGDVGATGLTGDVGATGLTGDVGATGADSTVPGATGDVGATGETGATGAVGPDGISSIFIGTISTVSGSSPLMVPSNIDTAYPTATYGNGVIALDTGHLWVYSHGGPPTYNDVWIDVGQVKGDTGATGFDGATGASGIDGATGASGIDGATGASGIDGATGEVGATGASGIDGINFAGTWNIGNSYPVNSVVYRSTDNNEYISIQDVPGNAIDIGNISFWNLFLTSGATGATGASGIDGATGASGIDGATGASGIDGATGASGIDGATGASGIDGATGASGIDGATGASGIDGATGTPGDVGATGLDGATGASGIDGATGATGPAGTPGGAGGEGATGATGTFHGVLTANVDGGGYNISNLGELRVNGNIHTGNIEIIGNAILGNIQSVGNITSWGNGNTTITLAPTGNIIFNSQDLSAEMTISSGSVNVLANLTVVDGGGRNSLYVSNSGLTSIYAPTTILNTQSALSLIGSTSGNVQPRNYTGTMLQITGQDGQSARVSVDSFGSGAYPSIAGRTALGTVDNPTAIKAGNILTRYTAQGFGTTTYQNSIVRMDFQAQEDFSDGVAGTEIVFWATPTGGNVIANVVQITGQGLNLSPGKYITFSDGSTQSTAVQQTTGTWTPTLNFATSQGSQTYTTQIGNYVKTGRLVVLNFDIVLNTNSGTGNVTIAGLPFTSDNQTGYQGSLQSVDYAGSGDAEVYTGTMAGNSSTIALYAYYVANPGGHLTLKRAVSTDFGATLSIGGTITYISNS